MAFQLIKESYFKISIFFLFFLLNPISLILGDETNNISYKLGKPYKIKDIWYYPKADYNYNQVGFAA